MINKTTKLIALLLITAFFWGCSSKASEYAGKVNDRFITTEEYNVALRNQFESYILDIGLPPDAQSWKKLSDKAWNNLIEGIVFNEQLKEFNIVVNYQEVIDSLKKNVPDVILNSKQFSVDGQFDSEVYHQSLTESNPFNLSWLISFYRDVHIPREKLKNRILSNLTIPETELRNEYLIRNSSASASIIHFSPENFENIAVGEDEIRDYYLKNRTDYVIEPYASVQYVTFDLTPSAYDSTLTKVRADSVYQDLLEGTGFVSLVVKESDAESAKKRGELPFIELNDFPSTIAAQIAKLEINGFTKPIQVSGGWVLYQLAAKTVNMVKLRELYLTHKASPETQEKIYENIVNIRQLASEIGLEKTAYEYNLPLVKTERIPLSKPYIAELGKSEAILERAARAKPGTLFEPILHKPLQKYILLEVMESQRPDFMQIMLVADDIREILVAEKQLTASHQEAAYYFKKYKYNNILPQAKNSGYPVYNFDNFNAKTYFPETDVLPLARAMFSQQKGSIVATPVKSDKGSYIGVVHRYISSDFANYPQQRDKINEDLLEDKMVNYFEDWLYQKINSAKVRDWRPAIDRRY